MRVEPLKVESKGWGNNAFKITPTNLQQRKRERKKMNQPKDMVICIDPRTYYICIKKYREVWKQDP